MQDIILGDKMKRNLKEEYKKQRQVMHEEYLKEALLKEGKFREEEKDLLYNLLSSLKYGVNKIIEILNNLWEVSKRDEISIKEIINKLNIDEIMNNDKKSLKEKGELVRSLVFKARFPQITEFMDIWKEKIKGLKLPNGIKIEPPPNFEGDKIFVSIEIKTLDDYRNYLKKLNEIEPKIIELLDLL